RECTSWRPGRHADRAARDSRRVTGGARRRLANGVDDHAGVDAMRIPRVTTEEGWCVVLRSVGEKAIIAAQAPLVVRREPLHAAPHVAGEEGLIARDADAGALEHREAADAAGNVRSHRRSPPRRHDDVAGVTEQVWRLRVATEIAELEVRRGRDQRA